MPNLYLDKTTHIKPFLSIGVADTSKDTQLDLLNSMATAIIDHILNVDTLARQVYVDERAAVRNGNEIHVRNFPVVTVSSVKQGSAGTLYTQTESYILKKNIVYVNGALAVDDRPMSYEGIKVSYTGGYITFAQNASGTYAGQTITLPDDIIAACLYLVGGMFNQKNNMGVSSYNIQGRSVVFRDGVEGKDFERIMNRYKKDMIVAI